MQLIDADGNTIDSWISNGSSHVIRKIPAGNYTIHEVYAPDGYVISTDIAVTVKEDGTILCNNTEVTAVSDDGLPLIIVVDDATKVKMTKRL